MSEMDREPKSCSPVSRLTDKRTEIWRRWLGQGLIAAPRDGYCVVCRYCVIWRCCVVWRYCVVRRYCVLRRYCVIWRCVHFSTLLHSWSHCLTTIPMKYTCQMSRRSRQFPLFSSIIEGSWRLCKTNQVPSKTDFDSIISFPNEETSSEREMTRPEYHGSTNDWTMSRIQEKFHALYSEKDQTGLYNQMTHVGSSVLEIYFGWHWHLILRVFNKLLYTLIWLHFESWLNLLMF